MRAPTAVLACLVVASVLFLVPLAAGRNAGTLTLQMEVRVTYPPRECPADTPAGLSCFARTGVAVVPGLGRVEEAYAYVLDENPTACGPEFVRGQPSTAELVVARKGAIEVRVSGTDCLARVPPAPVRGNETFTVTGGSGKFAGASGAGTIAHVSNGPPGWTGQDTWSGTLVVPGLEFDLTPPTISGARDKVVRAPRTAKRVRVTYDVSAVDEVDGSVPVDCKPKSGSRFRVGRRVTVRCSATDASANKATARFTVAVRKR
jgi:hypothetical protein